MRPPGDEDLRACATAAPIRAATGATSTGGVKNDTGSVTSAMNANSGQPESVQLSAPEQRSSRSSPTWSCCSQNRNSGSPPPGENTLPVTVRSSRLRVIVQRWSPTSLLTSTPCCRA